MSSSVSFSDSLPLLLAGPILRKCTASELTLWLVTSEPLDACFSLYHPGEELAFYSQEIKAKAQIQIGHSAWVTLACLKGDFPVDTILEYQLVTQGGDITALVPDLLYPGEERLTFSIKTQADYVLHGSCRNPHHPSKDSLVAADSKVADQLISERPSLLMMSGDQIYADHVAGPMLDAIQQVIALLGLPEETFAQGPVANTQSLYQHGYNFYGRDKLLPHYVDNGNWLSDSGLRKWLPHRGRPIFSSRECENHLMSFSEFFAMYLLVWSPQLWQLIDSEKLKKQGFQCGDRTLELRWQLLWHEEKLHIDEFVAGLSQVQRLMAHIPTYMIFDDHDVTDDWNLTVGWEKAAYENLLSRRIIGNGLISYWLCQGWGNAPEHFDESFLAQAKEYFSQPSCESQDQFINYLYRFEQWHYTIETTPKMLVLDTRTRRWRSESKMNKPSGLMDWEALTELQQSLLNEPAVIIVSAAPMFGVKFIETLQRGMTWLGQPLLIDAENWMAQPGAANTLLSIFTHTKTPTNFVILSGDVHYSFAYDVKLRFRRSTPNIYQITSSGIKNEFPNALLRFCDVMDRALYSPHSPLNWFTKRKRLKISKRDPDTTGNHRLVNRSAIGELRLDKNGKPNDIAILTAEGERVSFPPIER
ncbi:alkaline phosphatase family protein [Photobacterium sp. SDRW27]|uniref:alkaline phosphatase D family protein n=1 Tax=Photobacterium obscurum TaxID=2829490 RepID=UPI002243BD94|nr:alkaline phosphatase D family protein [Photobacterium obscurum]MCW8328410.1 alkaline phosphatase family protein [Photobacterium obscurum]